LFARIPYRSLVAGAVLAGEAAGALGSAAGEVAGPAYRLGVALAYRSVLGLLPAALVTGVAEAMAAGW
jgi:hypothetical protein